MLTVLTVLSLLPVLLGAQQCPSMSDPAVEPRLACFLDRTPACPEDRRHCFGLHLHLADGAEQDPAWIEAQLDHAHKLFAPASVGFEIAAVDAIEAKYSAMRTRYQRDQIGRSRFTRGVVHVFLVARLDDVDVPGAQIRGVHWRQRSNTDKRWVILSQIGGKVVMGHELGHFFGLPHSRYPDSVMNKQPRERPTWEERVFVPEELAIITAKRDGMLVSGMLESRAPALSDTP